MAGFTRQLAGQISDAYYEPNGHSAKHYQDNKGKYIQHW
jgi:hypothetical protein